MITDNLKYLKKRTIEPLRLLSPPLIENDHQYSWHCLKRRLTKEQPSRSEERGITPHHGWYGYHNRFDVMCTYTIEMILVSTVLK